MEMVVWTLFVRSMFYYDIESLDHAFNTWFGMVHVVPLVIVWFLGGMKEM